MPLLARLRALLQRRRVARELDDELRFHLQMETDANLARGMAPDEARRRALADFGGVVQAQEAVREVRTLHIESLWQDVRYAVRTLSATPSFTLAAAGMLALGIGITTAMFTIVDALILRPVPFRAPDQLARLLLVNERGISMDISPAVLRAWRSSPAFEAAEVATRDTSLIEAGDAIVTRTVAAVTPGVFDLLGVRPLHGRLFDDGSSESVLISETLWRTVLGGDPAIIGRPLVADGTSLTVVGILPADFRFPTAATTLWRPLDIDAGRRMPHAYVRIAKGVPRQDALRLAVDAARDAEPERDWSRAQDYPLAGAGDAYSTLAVPLMGGAVVLIFVILCANVCSLLLARLTARRREFSMRAALGASRGRLVRQALLESAVLGAAGVACGLAVAWTLVSTASALLPDVVLAQSLNPLNLDARALTVSSAAGCAGALLAGLLPAWLSTRVDANESLRVVDRGVTESRGARGLARGLLVGEIALACTLLVGATLLVRSFVNLATADRGIDTTGIMMVWLYFGDGRPDDPTALEATARTIEDELRRLPGAQQVAWSYGVPPRGGVQEPWHLSLDAPGASAVTIPVDWYIVSPEFFPLYGIPILHGRSFAPSDPPAAVIVSERLAQTLWPDANPVGRTFHRIVGRQPADKALLEVIGVARELHYPAIDRNVDRPEVYTRFSLSPAPMVSVRCRLTCPDAAVFRHRLAATHPEVRVQAAAPIERDFARELAWPRAAAGLAGAFAVIAVLAAAGGLFSVLSHAVGRRRREFGIRTALGASPAQIRHVVLRDGLQVGVAGVAVGAGLGALLSRALSSLQYGVTPSDPLTWTLVLALLGATTLLACWRPARAAARLDPAQLLREE